MSLLQLALALGLLISLTQAATVVFGACCYNETCTDSLSPAVCVQIGGVYGGNGTSCSWYNCNADAGHACCLRSGDCYVVTNGSLCSNYNGLYGEDNRTCYNASCQRFVGACCVNATCRADTVQSECTVVGGIFWGTNTDCSTFNCSTEGGFACCVPNGDNGVCYVVQDVETCFDQYNGSYYGDNINCSDTTCGQPPAQAGTPCCGFFGLKDGFRFVEDTCDSLVIMLSNFTTDPVTGAGLIGSLSAYVGTTAPQTTAIGWVMSLYDQDPTLLIPVNLLAQTEIGALVPYAWNTLSVTVPAEVAAGATYWLAFESTGNSCFQVNDLFTNVDIDTFPGTFFVSLPDPEFEPFGTWPAVFPPDSLQTQSIDEWSLRANYICPPQACCFGDVGNGIQSCQNLLPDVCTYLGGVVGPAGTTCDQFNCSSSGGHACCIDTGYCVTTQNASSCPDFYQGDSVSCSQTSCTRLVGACCVNATCIPNAWQPDCFEANGVWYGIDTDCSTFDCFDQGGSACCLPSGDCYVEPDNNTCVTEFDGTWFGVNVSCSEANCPPPIVFSTPPPPPTPGACCLLDICVSLTRTDCEQIGGIFGGEGSICSQFDCSVVGFACCFVGGQCGALMQTECIDNGGIFLGASVNCANITCPVPTTSQPSPPPPSHATTYVLSILVPVLVISLLCICCFGFLGYGIRRRRRPRVSIRTREDITVTETLLTT